MRSLVAKRETEDGIQRVEMQLPGLVCMLKCDYEPRMPSIKGVMKANRTQIPEVGIEDLGLNTRRSWHKRISNLGFKSFQATS